MIKAILLDLEGVLINIDYKKTFEAFAELGKQIKYDKLFADLVESYDAGKIDTQQLFTQFKHNYGWQDLTFDKFVQAWNAMLLFMPDDRIEYLLHLKQKYSIKLFILSNINELHAKVITENYGDILNKMLDATPFYSYEIKLLKPASESFQHVLSYLANQFNLVANNVLFLDDTKGNVVAAEKLGMRAKHFVTNGIMENGAVYLGHTIMAELPACSIKSCQQHLWLAPSLLEISKQAYHANSILTPKIS